jgi:hypothetical protein
MSAILDLQRGLRMTSAACERQPLNPLDLTLHGVDETIRSLGYPGFETQMLVWLRGPLDAALLQRGITRLARRHPALMGRLVSREGGRTAHWQFHPAAPQVVEIQLPSDDPLAVHSAAARLLSLTRDLAKEPPLQFHLLHRSGGSDVLLLQYNHVLMDNGAAVPLVKELVALCEPVADGHDRISQEPDDLVSRRLRRASHAARREAALAAIRLQGDTLRGRAATLAVIREREPGPPHLRISTRTLEPAAVQRLTSRGVELCGLPSLSMTILASALRAVGHFGPADQNAGRNYMAGIGLDVGLRPRGRPLVQNLLSVVPLAARPDALADREALVRLLSRQFRDRLSAGIDQGVLRLARVFQKRPRHIRWYLDYLLRWSYSLWYAYFGVIDDIGEVAGAPVEQIYFVGPTWWPIGFTLLANQFRGRLHMQATYDPALLADPVADRVLDWIVADLTDFAARPPFLL